MKTLLDCSEKPNDQLGEPGEILNAYLKEVLRSPNRGDVALADKEPIDWKYSIDKEPTANGEVERSVDLLLAMENEIAQVLVVTLGR